MINNCVCIKIQYLQKNLSYKNKHTRFKKTNDNKKKESTPESAESSKQKQVKRKIYDEEIQKVNKVRKNNEKGGFLLIEKGQQCKN